MFKNSKKQGNYSKNAVEFFILDCLKNVKRMENQNLLNNTVENSVGKVENLLKEKWEKELATGFGYSL